jgi:adenylate kinase
MRLLIMGPPGAGKGTQAKGVGAHYQIPTISTGDIFRAMQHSTTPLAEQVRAIMAVGGYVTDDVTNAIVAERLSQPDCQAGFLLDGYPRTLAQVTNLDSFLAGAGHAIDAVIFLQADEEAVADRLLRRAEIENRPDDTEATIRTRRQVYTDQTAPLLDVYRQRGLLLSVDGIGPVEAVAARLFAELDRHLGRPSSHAPTGRP